MLLLWRMCRGAVITSLTNRAIITVLITFLFFYFLLFTHHQARTPIEICPSSNLKTLRLGRLTDHPTLGRWLKTSHPISINTDGALLLWCRLLFWRTE